MSVTVSGTNGLTFNDGSSQQTAASGFGFKNRIINGAMAIWQRGTTTGSVAGTTAPYMVDRFYGYAGTGNITISQSSDVPSGFTYSCSMLGTGVSITQRIESKNCADLGGATVTVSFWAKSTNGSDNLIVALYTATGGVDNYSSQTAAVNTVSASPSGSWTYYTTTFTGIPSTATNGTGIAIGRGANATSTTLITGVQLEKGSTATSFDYRPYSTEYDLCRRYCEVYSGSTEADVIPQGIASADIDNRPETLLQYYPKRVSPTVTVANGAGFTWFTMANTTATTTTYIGTLVGTGTNGANLFFNVSSGVTAGSLSAVGYFVFNGANQIIVSAEL